LKKDLEVADSDIVMVDGVRYPNEVEMLRGFEKSILFFVDAPSEIRFERVRKRGEKGEGKIDYAKFLRAEKRETERYLDDINAMADYNLDNSGSFEDLYRQVDIALKEHGL
jgi:dephospho-CoA kinase